jgi:hypothetical protein
VRKLVVLGVIVFGLLVVDLGAKLWAQGRIEAVARQEAPEASADADIDALPFLPPLFAGGDVAHVDLVLRNVGVERVRFDRLSFSLDGVEVSRRALFRERKVELVDIDRGTVAAEIDMEAITRLIGRDLPEGQLTGRVRGRSLELRAGPASLTVPLPRASLLPCEGRVVVSAERVSVSCTVTEIPPGLVEAVSRAR